MNLVVSFFADRLRIIVSGVRPEGVFRLNILLPTGVPL